MKRLRNLTTLWKILLHVRGMIIVLILAALVLLAVFAVKPWLSDRALEREVRLAGARFDGGA